jgi:hypothetical protein
LPARQQIIQQQRIVVEQFVGKIVRRRQHQGDNKHDEKRELEAGFKHLARIPQQDDEGGDKRTVHYFRQ